MTSVTRFSTTRRLSAALCAVIAACSLSACNLHPGAAAQDTFIRLDGTEAVVSVAESDVDTAASELSGLANFDRKAVVELLRFRPVYMELAQHYGVTVSDTEVTELAEQVLPGETLSPASLDVISSALYAQKLTQLGGDLQAQVNDDFTAIVTTLDGTLSPRYLRNPAVIGVDSQ